MTGAEKRAMPDNTSSQSKKRKGGAKYQPQGNRTIIESGDWGVFVSCDKGRESKCIAEALDLFSQSIEDTGRGQGDDDGESSSNEDDIETQIRKEVEGLKPEAKKPRQFQGVMLDIPCEPIQMVHKLCADAQAYPEKKRGRWIQRMTPMTSVRKTLSVDFEAFAKEILKPHFHSGGPPKKYAIRPSVSSNKKFDRNTVIKTVADIVGPDHPVDLKNYDLVILVTVVQNVIGMSVLGSDYDQLKRYNLAELYSPTPKPQVSGATESKA